jgi:hypothetical protein
MMTGPGAPGWWQASDGNYYPPESHPDYRPPASSDWTLPQHPAGTARSQPSRGMPRQRRWLFLGIGAAVLGLIAGVSVVAILGSNGITAIPDGPGTGTVTWNLGGGGVSPKPQSFSGTADGLPISGVATTTIPSGLGGNLPSSIPAATWTGTFGGTRFDLKVAITLGNGSHTQSALNAGFTVDGTYGTQRVAIVARPVSPTSNLVRFTGTVGNLSVAGTVNEPSENGRTGTVHASFTVSK